MTSDRLRATRNEVEVWLSERGLDATLSASRHSLHRRVTQEIESHGYGRALEAGAGHSPFASVLKGRCSKVTRLDVDDSRGHVDVVGDIQNMTMFEDESFDTVLCTQVLEHVPTPDDAFKEMARVLKPGGVLILSAPHLSMVHEGPHDYFRFTAYGLRRLIEQSGMHEFCITPTAGLVTFLSHPLSLALWTTLGRLSMLRWPTWVISFAILHLVEALDRILGLRSRFPLDHVLVAMKPDAA